MSETYCGKDCGSCPQREAMNCPGCKAGPGAAWPGECELAKCCRDRGHETCGTCTQQKVCGLWNRREEMPARRRERREFEARKLADQEARKKALAEDAAVLARWLWPLFWLIVPGTIAGLMSDDTLSAYWPGLVIPGEILGFLCTVAYGLFLLKLAGVNERYRTAGICLLVGTVVSTPVTLLAFGAAWTLVVLLPVAAVALAGEYQEYIGHAEVLEPVDLELSEKWRRLWKWYIGTFLALFAGFFVALISALLGLLVMLASVIGTIVVSILKLVYLWRTARTFREYEAA